MSRSDSNESLNNFLNEVDALGDLDEQNLALVEEVIADMDTGPQQKTANLQKGASIIESDALVKAIQKSTKSKSFAMASTAAAAGGVLENRQKQKPSHALGEIWRKCFQIMENNKNVYKQFMFFHYLL